MSRKAIVLIVVLLLAACGLASACGMGVLVLSMLSGSPTEPTAGEPGPGRTAVVGPGQADGAIAWEKLITLHADDPALANLEWSSSGKTVYNTAAGYTLDFDNTGQVSQLTLHAGLESRRFAQYRGELPYGLTWDDTFKTVARKLGPPDWVALGLRQIWSAGSLGPYRIELAYYEHKDHDDIGDAHLSTIFISP